MPLTINMAKTIDERAPELAAPYQVLSVSMEKAGLSKLTAMIRITLDWSWSTMGDAWQRFYYRPGPNGEPCVAQRALNRIIPVALACDENAGLDGTVFSAQAIHMDDEVRITDPNWRTVVSQWTQEYQRKAHEGQKGTNLLAALQSGTDLYVDRYSVANGGWMEPAKSGWRSHGPRVVAPAKIPMLDIIIFDGDPNPGSERAIIELLESEDELPIFRKFIGLGDEKFNFPKQLDDELNSAIDHVDFNAIRDIDAVTDEELYNGIILNEFAKAEQPGQKSWLQIMADRGLIVPMTA